MALSDKISNIIGVKLPDRVLKQFRTRSQQTSKSGVRNNDNLIYLENKTAWIRLVSSINTPSKADQKYFSDMGIKIEDQTSLAKNYVLFGGTSKYLNKNSYQVRSGISNVTPQKTFDGQYGMLGENEINKYGFRPMPGITSVNIETQGRLGSIRQATINFKCWDKMQLDIIDTLYFKLGFTAFLEWGHTYYYDSSGTLKTTETYSIDPFSEGLTKEAISYRVAQNSKLTEGNYDGMLGMITNFTFTYNQEGGYDCTVKIIGLGVLAESIKINNSSIYSNIYSGALDAYNRTLEGVISDAAEAELSRTLQDKEAIDITKITAEELINQVIKYDSQRKYFNAQTNVNLLELGTFIYPYDETVKLSTDNIPENADVFIQGLKTTAGINNVIVLRKLNSIVFQNEDVSKKVQLDANRLFKLIKPGNEFGIDLKDPDNGWPGDQVFNLSIDFDSDVDFISKSNNRDYNIGILTDKDLTAVYSGSVTSVEEVNKLVNGTVSDIKIAPPFYQSPSNEILTLQQFNKTKENLSQIVDSLYSQLDSNEYWPLEMIFVPIEREETIKNFPGFKVTVDAFIDKPAPFVVSYKDDLNQIQQKTVTLQARYKIPFEITFNDTSLIKDFKTEANQFRNSNAQDKNIRDQDQVETPETQNQDPKQTPDPKQTEDPLKTATTIELILRTIQLYTREDAIKGSVVENGVPKLKDIHRFNMVQSGFYKYVYSNGVFDSDGLLQDLVEDKVSDTGYNKSESQRFKVYSKYGFATNLMTGFSNISDFKPVDFNSLLTSYLIPYEQSSDEEGKTQVNYPTYITLGNLLMIINNHCSLYENSQGIKKPLIYVDFNPNHNFCLSNPQQLSIDPLTAMIPFQGSRFDYKDIFPEAIIDAISTGIDQEGNYILDTSNFYIKLPETGSESIPSELFKPEPISNVNGDVISSYLPPYKYINEDPQIGNYKGSIMNVLLNIDYLIGVVRSSAEGEEEYKVFLKQFIEKVLIDINRCLGNINSFRLSYNDQANCLQIIDDQIIPTTGQESQLKRSTPPSESELPLLGVSTIAKSLEIKTEVTTRLANMIAISANANAVKNAGGTDGENFGHINKQYEDRYIPDRTLIEDALKDENSESKKIDSDAIRIAAAKFNQLVKSIYGLTKISKSEIEGSTNFYLERISENKSEDSGTRAANMIPVSVNFKTHGISGLAMGHAFTIPEELLPYTYSKNRIAPYTTTFLNKVGFAIMGLNHTIESNIWDTSIRGVMIFLKDNGDYKAGVSNGKLNVPLPQKPGSSYHGEKQNLILGSRTPRNVNKAAPGVVAQKSKFLFGTSIDSITNQINTRAHGAREYNQVDQWQSANAWDLLVPAYTPIYAIFDGVINNINYLEQGDFVWGYRFTLLGIGNNAWYTHLDSVTVKEGAIVKKGDLLGFVGEPPRPPFKWPTHLHIALSKQNSTLSQYLGAGGKIL